MVISAKLNSKRVKFIPPSESITCQYLKLVKLLQRVKLKVFKTSEGQIILNSLKQILTVRTNTPSTLCSNSKL